MLRASIRVLALAVLILVVIPANLPEASSLKLVARVDPRIELLSIVFRLAGNSEYNMDQLPRYTTDIDHYFSEYKADPAVLMAKRLANRNGVRFDAVMAMAVDPLLHPR